MNLQIGDKVLGYSMKRTATGAENARGVFIPGVTENTLTGTIKSIDTNLYAGVEITLDGSGKSEWFHHSSLTLINKPF